MSELSKLKYILVSESQTRQTIVANATNEVSATLCPFNSQFTISDLTRVRVHEQLGIEKLSTMNVKVIHHHKKIHCTNCAGSKNNGSLTFCIAYELSTNMSLEGAYSILHLNEWIQIL